MYVYMYTYIYIYIYAYTCRYHRVSVRLATSGLSSVGQGEPLV